MLSPVKPVRWLLAHAECLLLLSVKRDHVRRSNIGVSRSVVTVLFCADDRAGHRCAMDSMPRTQQS